MWSEADIYETVGSFSSLVKEVPGMPLDRLHLLPGCTINTFLDNFRFGRAFMQQLRSFEAGAMIGETDNGHAEGQ